LALFSGPHVVQIRTFSVAFEAKNGVEATKIRRLEVDLGRS
jgi:hypothetical protein